ncbi:hypothetical protein AOQ84DRAFT_130435 [Glonium stellatum]|uniref:Uncharacterized protein n=1 Tax=Glonium stellatum TaxID=574774 RepID=A0A8E2ESG4_9PEZI|nr:hypothetical protein AOQ84DRAFT_130435 [Glonium stellatum]
MLVCTRYFHPFHFFIIIPFLAGRTQGYWCLNWSSLLALSFSCFGRGVAEKPWASQARNFMVTQTWVVYSRGFAFLV